MEEIDIKSSASHRGVPIIREKSHEILIDYIKKYKPKRVLEIGTAVGYSGIAILENGGGELITIEHNEKLAAEAKQNFAEAGLESRARVIVDDCLVEVALMVADDKYNGYFDFIFLDGPKAQYGKMLEGLVMLLKSGGVLLVDNVLFRGYVDGKTIPPTKRFETIIQRLKTFINQFNNHPELKNKKLIDIEDGMLFAEKI